MKTLRAMFARFAGLFRRQRHEAEMNEELRTHLDALAERNLAAGMSPDEARHAAHRAFGGVAQIAERARDERRSAWGEHLLRDLRYAGRQLRKAPGFAAVVVLSLALGIGANTLFFGLLDRAVLQSLAVKDPGGLIRFQWQTSPTWGSIHDGFEESSWRDGDTGALTGSIFSLATFEQFRANQTLFTEVFAFGANSSRLVLSIDGRTESAWGQFVSGNYYRALGVTALHGRTLLPDDERPDAPPVAVISHPCWRRYFASDPAIVGKTIWINQAAVTVVGVMPDAAFDPLTAGLNPRDFTQPLTSLRPMDPGYGARKSQPQAWWLRIMARLQDGVTPAQAVAALDGVFQRTHREGLKKKDDPLSLRAVPGGRGLMEQRGAYAEVWFLPSAMAALVLMVACANVATLLLARGSARRREIAVRLALGAGRGRIVRQLITESLLLAVLGAGLGVLLALWGGMALNASALWAIDGRMLAFTSALALVTALAFGLLPALRATRVDLTAEFQGGSRTRGRDGRAWISQSLVVGQVALSCALLIVAGLFVRTLRNLRTVDVAFNRSHLLLVSVDATVAGYKGARTPALFTRIAERIAALPGARSATFGTFGQLTGGFQGRGFLAEREVPPGLDNMVQVQEVAPNYFATYEIPLVAGRAFTAQDVLPGQRVVVINERAAKLYFGDQDPIGRRTGMDGRAEIIGVVRNAKLGNLRTDAPAAYLAFAQSAQEFATFSIRTAGDPALLATAVRKAIGEIEPNLLITAVRTQEEQIEGMLGNERFFAQLATAFGGLALALACVGLYGLMSYAVVRRTGEIGVRMALGAVPAHVLWMVLRESLGLALLGVVVGVAGSAAAVRTISGRLFGLSSTDPATYAIVAALLIVVALLAAFLPARRAAKIDPIVALRCE